ncbi:tetratricopeptide repeat protein [Bordetella sp. BOR01]|uniref:type III secretion apparatus assembly chaperone SctY n=1 Tax=Bordetella sp. BOR01 TaxID=2854779 RepID=UPI001C4449F6|nr:tetratricopeptide repeat protein [Bordetella sp. BOR01]MBV7485215.1 tetratricopeptide repeat protein [Bordetella sp. BOR01]
MSAAPLALDADGADLLGLLAYVYLENQKPDKAVVLLAALDTLGLADSRQQVSLALAQLRVGKPDRALAILEKTAMRGGVDAAFHLVRAQALLAQDRRDEAGAAMRAYVALRSRAGTPAVASLTSSR